MIPISVSIPVKLDRERYAIEFPESYSIVLKGFCDEKISCRIHSFRFVYFFDDTMYFHSFCLFSRQFDQVFRNLLLENFVKNGDVGFRCENDFLIEFFSRKFPQLNRIVS